jgi:hypothetical protein
MGMDDWSTIYNLVSRELEDITAYKHTNWAILASFAASWLLLN